MEGKRQLQVSKLIQIELSAVFHEKRSYLFGEILVTITQVVVSKDFQSAKIYLSVLNATNPEEILNNVEVSKKEIRFDLASRIKNKVRRIPELIFFLDDTLDNVFKIDSLLKELDKESDFETLE